MNSSLREATLESTLKSAKIMAMQLGITRVTDTTWLDRIGIPVYASIRPAAQSGNLCVNAGKGLRHDESCVGAYMEAIECAKAEVGRNSVSIFQSTPREIMNYSVLNYKFVDLCPRFGNSIDPDGVIDCVHAELIGYDVKIPVPAELVFLPYRSTTESQRIFGSTSNGLSSGNSVEEASVHGLAELLERDVQAFNFFDDQSQLIEFDESIASVEFLAKKINDAELDLRVRYTENIFGMAYIQAFIMEKSDIAPIAISYGSGFHPIKEIAMVRAISEAAQSRLSYIHGGRDDLVERYKFFEKLDPDSEIEATAKKRQQINNNKNMIKYSEIPDFKNDIKCINDAWQLMIKAISAVGIDQVLRVQLTDSDDSLSVVKIIVPKLESFEPELKRVGPRLKKYATTKR